MTSESGQPAEGLAGAQDARSSLKVHPDLYEACFRALLKIDGGRLAQIAVTSAVRGEGRSSVAAAVASVQAAEYGRRTLLIEADFEAPSLESRLGLSPGPGLAELVFGAADVSTALRPVADGVWVLTAGRPGAMGSRLSMELVASDVITELAASFDCRVVDLPPLLNSSAGSQLADRFGKPLLVVRAQSTPAAAVREALAGLHTSPHIILNGVHSSLPKWLQRIFSER